MLRVKIFSYNFFYKNKHFFSIKQFLFEKYLLYLNKKNMLFRRIHKNTNYVTLSWTVTELGPKSYESYRCKLQVNIFGIWVTFKRYWLDILI